MVFQRSGPGAKWRTVLALLALPLTMAQADPEPKAPRKREEQAQERVRPDLRRPFKLQSKLRGLVVDIENNNRDPGASLLGYPAKRPEEGHDNQVWELVPTHGGFLIRSRLNGLVLDIEGASREPGARVITYTPHGQPNQVWRLVPSEEDPTAFYIQSALNGFVLDIEGAPRNGSGRIIVHPINSPVTDNQLWRLVP